MTPGQQNAIEQLWDIYCLNPNCSYDYTRVFARNAPLFVEIGFGNGDSLAKMAEANPHYNYIGIEVHKPGIGHLLQQIKRRQISNVRIYCHDAVEILETCIPDETLSGLYLFFPDPWHKRRHHKRRLVKPDFIHLLAQKLKNGGRFHAATDWQNYADQILQVLLQNPLMVNTCNGTGFSPRPDYRPLTKFEKRGIRLGHEVWDLIFEKNHDKSTGFFLK